MTSREAVQATFAYTQPQFTPCDYFGTPEIQTALLRHFGVERDDELLDCLGTDIRFVNPPYTGPRLPVEPDGSTTDVWGVVRRPMANEYGDYLEPTNYPYAGWLTVEEAAAFPWPSPDWYDCAAIPALCAKYPDKAIATGSFGVQDFINGVAFGRGVEQVLMDIAEDNPVYLYIVEKRHAYYMELYDRILSAAQGRIDLVLCGDDFGSQRSCLISPDTFDRLYSKKKREFFEMVHGHGAKVSHHCCGSSRQLIPRFVAVGMDALQTIQPRAEGMDPYALKQDFGGQIVLHGAVDVQGGLQRATPQEVETEVNKLADVVGKGGGFILGPCHNIQPDTPLENVLTVYRTMAQRRVIGTSQGRSG